MKVLFIGDIVGSIGTEMLQEYLPMLKAKYKPQVTIVNGENTATNGRGITKNIYKSLLQAGVDRITMGNHTWDNRELVDFIDEATNLIRPANYAQHPDIPGDGISYVKVNQQELAIINLIGRTFMGDFDDPFKIGEELVNEALQRTPHIFIDFHAETTSEKEAMGWFMDGRASAVLGTHTHVQTNDARILTEGTAYLSDVGMTGFYDGVLGMEKHSIIQRFQTQMPTRFVPPKDGRKRLNGCYLEFHPVSGRAVKIKPIRIDDDTPFYS